MKNFIEFLKANPYILAICMCLLAGIFTIILLVEFIKAIVKFYKTYTSPENREVLKNKEYSQVKEGRGEIIRKLVCADAIDPSPNGYMVIAHGSKEYYVRSFTISKMPKKVDFAITFAGMMNFPNCISSFYVHPLSESAMSSKIDRHNHVLEAEYISSNDSNRRRRLSTQRNEAERWAREIETGATKFFDVGAIFTFSAEDLKTLNNVSDLFRAEAVSRGMEISNCYALQPEAFLANAPLNAYMDSGSSSGMFSDYISPSAAKFHLMDKRSVSTLYNYTQTSFSHKHGIILGRDLFMGKPVFFDIYDPSHLSFCGALFGGMGAGKSATIKVMVIRNRLFGYRYCALDGQQRKGGDGEYADLARALGGINFKISTDSGNVLNIFDVTESTQTVRNELGQLEEKVTLELVNTKSFIVSMLLRILQGDKTIQDITLHTYLRKTITKIVTTLYDEYEIFDGDASSLYEKRQSIDNGALSSGYLRKKLPTFSDFYVLAIRESFRNSDPTLVEAYNLILASFGDYVKEIYYSDRTGAVFTKAEYDALPSGVMSNNGYAEKYYLGKDGTRERVVAVRGTRTYFDGQSTLTTDLRKCPFLNIDISKLQEDEKPIARIVGMGFLNEHVIKKNSDVLDSADKLLLIIDEFHEIINDAVKASGDEAKSDGSSLLDMAENIIRTARKRNVGMLLCSQTVREFRQSVKCENIIGLMSFAFVFKQSFKDQEIVKNTFGLTDSQARLIVDSIGGKGEDDEEKKKHRGECCLIDIESKKVCFAKIDYFKSVEGSVVETDSVELAKMYGRSAG